jgi:hypothetical protein
VIDPDGETELDLAFHVPSCSSQMPVGHLNVRGALVAARCFIAFSDTR